MKELSLWLLCAAAVLPAQGRQREPWITRAGDWRVEIHYEATSQVGARATSYRQEVLRFAPGAEAGERIHVESSTGRTGVFLRDDGLCFVDPVQREPFLSFVGGQQLSYPLRSAKAAGPGDRTDLDVNGGGRVHFLGDACVVVRRLPTLLQVAAFEVDVQEQTATGLQEVLEVDGQGWPHNVKAAMPDRLMLRMGDLLLWVNTGVGNAFSAKAVDARWRTRRLHAYSLERRAFVELGSVDYALFARHREHVVAFLEQKSHNVVGEFEIWAVERLGTWGFVNYTQRLLQLLASTKGLNVGQPDGSVKWDLRERRAVYLEALTKLNAR